MAALENITISQLLRRATGRYPLRPALEYNGNVITYHQLDTLVDRYALSLLQQGIQKRNHVAILCETEPNTIILSYALARIGAVTVMLNTSLQRAELTQLLRSADVQYLLIGDGYKDIRYLDLCSGLPAEISCLKQIFYIGQEACAPFPALLPAPGTSSFEPVFGVQNQVVPQDTAHILFTSGTGSAPKAVMTRHYNRVNSGIQQAKDLAATCEDRFCVAMPVFHCFSLSVNVFAACAVGACLYLPESRRTEALLRAISFGKCTIFSCVPALFHALLKRPDLACWDLSSLRTGFIGGSTYQEELFMETERQLGFTLLSSLGQTESTAGITTVYLHDPLDIRASTVGHFMDHIEGKIVDHKTGKTLPICIPGEICVRGYVVMQGYYNAPEETANVIDPDGWLHTGDIGYLDNTGNIHLTGRLKELIIRGGENISPREIEAALHGSKYVLDCKAVGVPDDHYGEEICLCIICDPAAPCGESQIRSILSSALAAFKQPKYILFLEGFPVTSTGKIHLKKLKAIAAERAASI